MEFQMIGLIPICLIVTSVHIAIHLSLVLLKTCGIPQGQGSVLGLLLLLLHIIYLTLIKQQLFVSVSNFNKKLKKQSILT